MYEQMTNDESERLSDMMVSLFLVRAGYVANKLIEDPENRNLRGLRDHYLERIEEERGKHATVMQH